MAFKGQNVASISLNIDANTSAAKKALEDLQKSLQNLTSKNASPKNFGLTKEIQGASEAAAELSAQLNAATNINTGRLDLSKFTQQLAQSGMSVKDYASQLSKLGPEGEQAFSQLAQAISIADTRIANTSGLINQLGKSLYNVAKYQLSTSILTGLTSTISSAYQYAQNLNESLNNIRIVTGESSESMARFAQQANTAAHNLSTTTTRYTDAALIFYQQGLKGEEVTKRTDAVIKMSQATGDAAKDVSSYMTAIWNNFDDGTESLEHYADVITALGASTAASSSEIADGLSKFASIAKTTGLSYDYATASLTALVANTRQSADTIGNSLKTIFARLQGFKLGETADDGVSLNKYSAALATVGVNALDAAGQMRDLDDILSDLAGKWNDLGSAQKNALAQTVAGTRQYANLISLLDNWDDVEKNLQTAATADGALNSQADIFAESWDAASNRVRASLESIFSQLVDDNFFIKLTNGFDGFLQIISASVKQLGGFKGVLLSLTGIATQLFSKQLSQGLSNTGNGLLNLIPQMADRRANNMREAVSQELINNEYDDGTNAGAASAKAYEVQGRAQQELMSITRQLNAVETARVANLRESSKIQVEEVQTASKKLKINQQALVESEKATAQQLTFKTGVSRQKTDQEVKDVSKQLRQSASAGEVVNMIEELSVLGDTDENIDNITASIANLQRGFNELAANGEGASQVLGEKLGPAFEELSKAAQAYDTNKTQENLSEFHKAYNEFVALAEQSGQTAENALNKIAEKMSGVDLTPLKTQFETATKEAEQTAQKVEEISQKRSELETKRNTLLEEQTNRTEGSNKYNKTAAEIARLEQELAGLERAEAQAKNAAEKAGEGQKEAGAAYEEAKEKVAQARKELENFKNDALNVGRGNIDVSGHLGVLTKGFERLKEKIAELRKGSGTVSGTLMGITSAVTSISSALKSISNMGDVWKDFRKGSLSTNDVMSSLLTTMVSVVPMLTSISRLIPMILTPVGATVGLVTLAIGGLIAAITHANAVAFEQSLAGQLSRAKKDAESLKTALSDVQSEASTLQSSFESYDSIVSKLAECTVGSDEFKASIAAANQEVLKILQTTDDYRDAISMDSNGLLVFDEEKRAAIDAEISSRERVLMLAEAASKARVASLESLYQSSEVTQDILDITEIAPAIKQSVSELIGGTWSESIAGIQGQNGKWLGNYSWQEFQQTMLENPAWISAMANNDRIGAISSMESILQWQDNDAAQNLLGFFIDALSTNLQNNNVDLTSGAMQIAAQSGNAANLAAIAGNKEMHAFTLSEASALNGIIGSNIDPAIGASIIESVMRSAADAYANIADTEIKDALSTVLDGKDIEYNSKTKEFSYEGSDGQQIVLTRDSATAILAASGLEVNQGEQYKTLLENRQNWFNSQKENDQLWTTSFINGQATGKGLNNLSIKDIKSLGAQYNDSTNREQLEQFASIMGLTNASTDELNSLGFDTIEQMYAAFLEGIQSASGEQQRIAQTVQQSAKNTWEKIEENYGQELSNVQRESIATTLNMGADHGVSSYLNQLYGQSTSAENIIELTNKLNNISDWSKITAEDFNSQFAGWISEDFNVQAFLDGMSAIVTVSEQAGTSVSNWEKAINGKNYGDTIKADAYATLGENAQSYFNLLNDGTYQLIGTAEELQAAIKDDAESMITYQNKIKSLRTEKSQTIDGQNKQISTIDLSKLNITEKGDSFDSIIQFMRDNATRLGIDGNQISDWINTDTISEALSSMQAVIDDAGDLSDIFEQNNLDLSLFESTLLRGSTSLKQFDENIELLNRSGSDISEESQEYADGLLTLAGSYINCADAVREYQEALANGNDEQKTSAANALRAEIRIGELANKYNISTSAIKAYAQEIAGENNDISIDNVEKAAITLSGATAKIKNAFDSVKAAKFDWNKIGDSKEATDALTQASEAIATFSNLTKELTAEQTLDVFKSLEISKNADEFAELTKEIFGSAEAARDFYNTIQPLMTDYSKLTLKDFSLETINEEMAKGSENAAALKAQLQELLNLPIGSTADSIQAISESLKAGLISASEAKSMNSQVLANSNLDTKSKLAQIQDLANEEIWDTTFDENGNEVQINRRRLYSDAELRQMQAQEIAKSKDMSYKEQDAELKRLHNEAETPEEKRGISQSRLQAIQSTDSLYDTEKQKEINALYQQGEITAYQYSSAIKDLVMNSKEFNLDEKIQAVNNAFGDDKGKEYKDTIIDIISNDSTLTTVEKIERIKQELQETGDLEAYSQQLIEIIASDSSLTTPQKIQLINDTITNGIANARELGALIGQIVNADSGYTAQMGFQELASQKEKIMQDARDDFDEEAYKQQWYQDNPLYKYGGSSTTQNQAYQASLPEAKDAAAIQAWQDAQTGLFNTVKFEDIDTLAASFGKLDDQVQQNVINNGSLEASLNGVIGQSSTLAELDENLSDAQHKINDLGIESIDTSNGQQMALQAMGSQYASCADELKKYNEALNSGTQEQQANARAALEASIAFEEYAEEAGTTSEELKDYADILYTSGKMLEKNTVSAAKHAALLYRQSKGFENVQKSLAGYRKELAAATKSGNDMAKSGLTKSIRALYKDVCMLDESCENLSTTFLTDEKNLQLLQDAADDVEGAFDELQAAVAKELTRDIELPVSVDRTEFDSFLDYVANFDFDGIQVDAEINDAEFNSKLSSMIFASEDAAADMRAAMSNIGVDAQIVEHTVFVPDENGTETWDGTYPIVTGVNQYGGPIWSNEPVDGEIEHNQPGHTQTYYTLEGATYNGKGVSGGGGSAPRGKGGGGGGGGRRRERQQKRPVRYDNSSEKKAKDEIERYHLVRNELESIDHELNMIEKTKNKAFGKDKLKAIEDETKALEKQKATQEEYLRQIEDWATTDAAAARSIGLEIDAEGHVTNYELKMNDWIEDYNNQLRQANKAENDAVNWWNSLSADAQDKQENKDLYDEKVEAAKRIAEVAQEEYDSRVDILQQYEETMDLLDKESETYQDIIDSIRNAMLEKIQYAVELKVEVNENALNILKDYLEDIGDKADGAADSLANFAEQANFIQNSVKGYQKGIQDILGLAGADNDLISRALNNELTAEDWALIQDDASFTLQADDVKTLEEYEQSLLQYNNTLRELQDKALTKVNEAFTEYNENLAKNSEEITHLQAVNQTFVNIIDIVGKKILDSSGQLSAALGQADFEMQRNNTHALKSQLNFIDESIAKTEAELQTAIARGDSKVTQDALKDSIQAMKDERNSTYEEWLDSWEAECQAASDIYETTLQNIVDNFNRAIGGMAGSLEALQEQFDRQKAIDDVYLEEYEQIYQLSKLTRDISKSIDETDSINSKKQLKKLTDEINKAQEEGNDLSQYDLDVLRAKYELELAREKMEDARVAKTAVRMTRDAEGNYGYVYTADTSAVEAAEQEYEDKLHAMQQLNSDYIDEMQEQILQAEADCSAALAELNASDYATYEEYQAAALQIQQDYGQLVEDYYQQLNNAIVNNDELYNGAWTNYNKATGYALDQEKEFVTNFGDTQLSILGGYNSIQDASVDFHEALSDAMNDSAQAWTEWYARTQIALSDGGTSIGDYADSITEQVKGANGLTAAAQEAEAAAASMEEEFNTAFDGILDALDNFLAQWDAKIQEQIKNNKLLSETIYQIIAEAAGEKYSDLHGMSASAQGIDHYDTGGYTGSWNSSNGKLAMLHEKELVLNAEDTANILNAVDSVRSISNMIDLNASTASANLASALQSTGALIKGNTGDTIAQTVSINAEFTDATTANEITEALGSLINKASQYANRKL